MHSGSLPRMPRFALDTFAELCHPAVRQQAMESAFNRRVRFRLMTPTRLAARMVQAAIGSAPLMAMRAAGMETGPGEIILAVAVLSIVMTAPTGAWAIAALGNRVLAVAPESVHDSYDVTMESAPDDDAL